jgi:hypothetical protein
MKYKHLVKRKIENKEPEVTRKAPILAHWGKGDIALSFLTHGTERG